MSGPGRRARVGIRLSLAMIAALSVTAATAQDERVRSDRPTVRLSVFQSSPSMTAPIDAEITLLNLTNRDYDIDKVLLHLPEGLRSIRPDYDPVVMGVHSIGDGEERIYSKGITQVTKNLLKAVVDTRTLLFVPGTYRLRAEVKLRDSADTKGPHWSLYATREVALEPPLSAALRGGVIGALLLALFVPAYRALSFRTRLAGGLREAGKQFVVYFLSGSVVAVTAILVIYRVGSANLPITVGVNDYLGGIIVGLFSYGIGNALYAQFLRRDGDDEGAGEAPPPGGPPTGTPGAGDPP